MTKTLFLSTAVIALATATSAETIRMSVTTSFANSGLAEVLLPEIEKDIGLSIELLVVGTGQALKLGETGDVDAVLVHSRPAEEAFVAAGFGTHRREIMYNDFVFVGPSSDPAGVIGDASAVEALQDIASAEGTFVSRGDDSGTHKMELGLWKAAGIAPEGSWYNAVGQGMGAALNTASGMDAYILADRASWLNFGNKGDLTIVFEGDPVLFNQYAFIPVNPALHPHVKSEAVDALEAWLTGDHAKALIEGYTIDGQQLFVFNATPE
jgi:tungstate transport system substrate-binding protein